MNDPIQVRFSGSGGQGLITAGIILAEAAMLEGRNVVQTQTYGPEARLGSSKAEVIISSGAIAYPEVTSPDLLLCLSAEAARKFAPKVRPDTLVILDSTCVAEEIASPGRVVRLPITETAVNAGNKVAANTVALGVCNELATIVAHESLSRAVAARVPRKFSELNQRALEAGEMLARSVAAGSALDPTGSAAC